MQTDQITKCKSCGQALKADDIDPDLGDGYCCECTDYGIPEKDRAIATLKIENESLKKDALVVAQLRILLNKWDVEDKGWRRSFCVQDVRNILSAS